MTKHLASSALMWLIAGAVAALAQTPASKPALAGTWNLSVVGDHVIPVGLVLDEAAADGSLTGTLMIMGKEVPLKGTFTAGALALTGSARIGMQHAGAPGSAGQAAAPASQPPMVELKITGAMKDDGTMAGEFAMPNGAMKWTGERLRQRPAAAVDLTGAWSAAILMNGSPMEMDIALKQQGTKITGTTNNEHLGTLAVSGTFENGALKFTASGQAQGQQVEIEFTAKLDAADHLAGAVKSQMGEFTWSATRAKK